jgi:hypothetical protein
MKSIDREWVCNWHNASFLCDQPAGWERSDTHQLHFADMIGFARLNLLRAAIRNFVAIAA